jgi:murein DD-endopeptidase MepM/ murein hydrolase activator NlpD
VTVEKPGAILALFILGCVGAGRAAEAEVMVDPEPLPEALPAVEVLEDARGVDPGEPREGAVAPPPVPAPAPDPATLSPPLSCGLRSPMPGSFTAGYAADTGLDLAGIKMPVYAIANGRVVYAEPGHSLWASPRDTDLAVLLELEEPIAWGERQVTHVWYAHLSELAFEQAEAAPERRRVVAGERLGTSGVANGAWHLHLGLLLDGDTSQRWGSFLLEDEVRRALCGLRPRQRLPAMKK